MSHGCSTQWKKDNSTAVKSRIGIWMFLIYTIVYAGFIMINVIKPEIMGLDVGSATLAVVYGVGLIVFAILLALIYNHLCTRAEERMNKETDELEEGEVQ
jgi:uncharacterized membrane protein (DUF485 family)